MNIYHFFDQLWMELPQSVESKSVTSIKNRFLDFADDLPQGRTVHRKEEPPFSQFANWLARRFGKSKPSYCGRWSRYDGGWWRIIEDQFGDNEIGYSEFFKLLTEYRQRKCLLKGETNLSQINVSVSNDSRIERLEVWEYPTESGYDLVIVGHGGQAKLEGFYSKIDELLDSASKRYEVQSDHWHWFTIPHN
ncbi:hypothetical protein Pan153_17910 [Gimesia panareensis]|uniref:Uncharacterized protein n=1 Tax=Gimesia panareensis TaxID=2527978 RepID=A0A518FLB5_9PLAN|nr:hypothetical protein [Gimesia panareensis]QDV17156.1 hypothetical protein Pan153_17910 [Gimesia panareensis]